MVRVPRPITPWEDRARWLDNVPKLPTAPIGGRSRLSRISGPYADTLLRIPNRHGQAQTEMRVSCVDRRHACLEQLDTKVLRASKVSVGASLVVLITAKSSFGGVEGQTPGTVSERTRKALYIRSITRPSKVIASATATLRPRYSNHGYILRTNRSTEKRCAQGLP